MDRRLHRRGHRGGQAAAAATSTGGAEAEVLRAIAADERRHAELAWEVLDWIWRTGACAARDAIAEAIAGEPEIAAAERPERDAGAARAAAEREVGEARERIRALVG
ncbi:MAG TPA: hypothetical protein VFU21_19135 [Kofleriaceae bacterium]|nr:hypothetical protein [Kofleriaceae bacterium]